MSRPAFFQPVLNNMDNTWLFDKIVLLDLFIRKTRTMINQLRQMAIFAKTIDHGSFRGAANELALSPSVVSHHIAQLEEHLGVALIYRSTRKLTLTRDGERLLVATQKMLEAVEGELHALSAEARIPSGELRITAPSVLSRSPFTDMIAAFMQTYPRIGLSLDFSDERKELIDDRFDVAIRMGLTAKRSTSTRKLFKVERRLVASQNFLDQQDTPTDPTELATWQWLELAPVKGEPITFRKDGVEKVAHRKTSNFSCNDAQALYRMARAGAGVAIVPEFLATERAEIDQIIHVLPEWELDPIQVYAQWPTNAPKNGLIKLLVDEISRYQPAN